MYIPRHSNQPQAVPGEELRPPDTSLCTNIDDILPIKQTTYNVNKIVKNNKWNHSIHHQYLNKWRQDHV